MELDEAYEVVDSVRVELRSRFVGRDDAIEAMLLGAVADLPVLFVGRPGTGKSRLADTLAELLGRGTEGGPKCFQYLLTEFTVPEEVFGYPDLRRLEEDGTYSRQDAEMVQHADIVFLDEILNGSSAILNALLSLLNERCFYDRGRRVFARFRILLGATQQVPDRPELAALWDRMTIRVATDWVDDGRQVEMVRKGLGHRVDRVPVLGSLAHVRRLGEEVERRASDLRDALCRDRPHPGLGRYLRLIRHLRDMGVHFSDRAVVAFLKVLAARAVLARDDALFRAEGLGLLRYAVDDPGDEDVLKRLEQAVQHLESEGTQEGAG